jgi:hypothetical protein
MLNVVPEPRGEEQDEGLIFKYGNILRRALINVYFDKNVNVAERTSILY